MTSGKWDGITSKIRPGIYYLLNEAVAAITGGERGVVAIPLFTYTGDAEAGKFYEIESQMDAEKTFGKVGAEPIVRVLSGGAKRALVYATPQAPAEIDYTVIRDLYEARDFNVFTYPNEVPADEQDELVAWCERNHDEGKHFFVVLGGTASEDQDIAVGNARSIRCKFRYVVNLVNGVLTGAGDELHSGIYASYIAGLIAGTPINKSITYTDLPVADVNRRFKNSEIEAALESGSLVLVNNGVRVKIEQGVTTFKVDNPARGKIRLQSGIQAILTDVSTTISDYYIGKINNDEAGQTTVISAIKKYLEMLAGQNVLTNPEVVLDPLHESIGDSMYIAISYTETDSAEKVYLTINL